MENSIRWREFQVPLDDEPSWSGQPFSLPIPNAVLRAASSVEELDAFLAIGEAWAGLVTWFLPPNATLLDVGCGCGKLARFLYLNPSLRYVGVDLFLPGIVWCRKAFEPLASERFRFEHFDGYSPAYNPEGTIDPLEYRWPCEDRGIDVVVCASLFTHLLEPMCRHYLQEIRRVLRPSGRAILSIHTQPAVGTRFSGDESRIDADPEYFIAIAGQCGLRVLQIPGIVYGQLAIVLEPAAV
jgi:SAM-dependent methyltransferase